MNTYKTGKNIIEHLTTGMYRDSKIIFREYIQNSADQIDKANEMRLFDGENLQIEIDIDAQARRIQIKDNATGIKAAEVRAKLANIADSDKDRDEDKGFRGIGRMGGLAYCDTLRFITSYKGEDIQTIMTWDAKKCRELIYDKSIKDSLDEILTKIINFNTSPCSKDEHFFTVELENIRKENSELLDVDEVRRYMSSNVPVPYNNKFMYVSKIEEYMNEQDLMIDEYCIHVNGNDILKNYSSILYENVPGSKKKYDEISDIQFKKFHNQKGEIIAWVWFGISSFDKQIPESTNEMRGLRLRKENIQIGTSNTLVPLFKEPRGNFYFVGEVHAVHKDLIPNSQRNYFIENEARNQFEAHLKYYFADTLHKLYYDANRVKNLYKKEIDLVRKQVEYAEKKQSGFVGKEEIESFTNRVKQATNENEAARKELKRIKERSQGNETLERVIEIIEKKHSDTLCELGQPIVITHCAKDEAKKNKERFITDGLHRLDSKQRKLVSKIYMVIAKTLPDDLSKNLIEKIQDELNK